MAMDAPEHLLLVEVPHHWILVFSAQDQDWVRPVVLLATDIKN
jgi:hypothetical protein